MNKIILMALAAALVSSCSKEEEAPEPYRGPTEQFNIFTSVLGGRSTGNTRAVIAGTAMPNESVIGVQVTQNIGGEAAYTGIQSPNTEENDKRYTDGQNIYFKGGGSTWASFDPSATTTAKGLYIGSEKGTVYAYYPYAQTVTGIGAAATVPVTILNEADIVPGEAAANTACYATGETDYLYYKPAADRATVSSTSRATATLTMAHAMASVSFRMYVSKDAPALTTKLNGDDKYYLMGYTIQNKTGKKALRAVNTSDFYTMKIADGTIAAASGQEETGGTIKRTINPSTSTTGYALTRSTQDGGTASDSEKNGLIWFSNLVLPVTSITAGDIEVVFSIRKGSKTEGNDAVNYAVPLAVTDTSGKWEAGNNYQYTVKLNAFLQLGITDVTVTDWVNVVGGDMVIQ